MKKVLILAFACLISFATFAQVQQGQPVQVSEPIPHKMTNTEIANMLNYACERAGITNPDKLGIGQDFPVLMTDNTIRHNYAKAGDTRWDIIDRLASEQTNDTYIADVLTPYEAKTAEEKSGTATPIQLGSPIMNEETNSSWPMYLVCAAVLVVLIYLVSSSYREKKAAQREHEQRARVTPETAGPPVVHGGITRENVEQVMIEAARRIHPNQAIIIDQLEQGTVDSHGHQVLVNYGDTPRMQVLENRPAVRATYRIQGRDDVYTGISLLGCANDIRMSNPMLPNLDHLTFTPTVANQRPGLTRDLAQERRQADSDSLKVTSTDFEVGMENLPSVIKTIADGNTNGDIKLDFGSVKVSVSVQQVAKPVEAA